MKNVVTVILFGASLTCVAFPRPSKDHVEVFNSLVAECVAFQRKPEVALSSMSYLHQKCPAYIELKEQCGLESLELIYDVLKKSPSRDSNDYTPLISLWGDLTHHRCVNWIIPWNPVGVVYVWEGGAEFEDEQISFLLSEMRLAAKEGRKNDKLVVQQIISCEGIFSFPKLFAELEAGHEDVVERLRKDNSYRLTMKWLNCDGYDDRSDSPWYCWQLLVDGKPDVATFAGYDNERREGVADVVVGNGWIAENADGLLTQHVCENSDDSGNVAEGREAFLHVFDIEHDLLWETGNKANQIFNPTPKDDASGEFNDAEVERDEAGNVKFRYAAPRNNLYVVSDSASRTFNVTEKIKPPYIPVKFIDRIMCAAFVEEEMVEGSATRFSGAYEAAMQIPAPGGAVKVDYALRVGIDVNDDGVLSFDESIPIEVYKYKTDEGFEPRYAIICGSTNERCVDCDAFIGGKINGVFGALTGMGVPIGKVLLSIFYYGNTNHLNGSVAFLPSKINTVTINAFAERSGFSEWLTHNSGAEFNNIGLSEIKEYVWNAQTLVSQLFANCSPLVPWVHYSLPVRNNFDYQSSIYGSGIPNSPWLKDEFDLETRTGHRLEEYFKRSVIPLARVEMQELPDGAVRTFPLDGGWYGVELFTNVVENMSHPCIEGTTVVFGDKGQHYKGAVGMGMEAGLKELVASGGQLGNLDAFIAIGRGRIVEPGYQFAVRKSVSFFGRVTYELVSIAFKCKIQDLYDFNFEDGDLSQNAATLQIGFGKGDYGRSHGQIFRHEIEINTVYQNPFVR